MNPWDLFVLGLNALGIVASIYNMIKYLGSGDFVLAQIHGSIGIANVIVVMVICDRVRKAHP